MRSSFLFGNQADRRRSKVGRESPSVDVEELQLEIQNNQARHRLMSTGADENECCCPIAVMKNKRTETPCVHLSGFFFSPRANKKKKKSSITFVDVFSENL